MKKSVFINKPYFCNICHKRIEPPDFIKNVNINCKGGIRIKCGNCKNGNIILQFKEIETEKEQKPKVEDNSLMKNEELIASI